MSNAEPRPLRVMQELAADVVNLLRPACTRIEIAGSIRRLKLKCSDIEVVCCPDFRTLRMGLLDLPNQNALEHLIKQLQVDDTLIPRMNGKGNPEAWADRHKRAYYKRTPLDLFIVLPDRYWGPTFLTRTGPGDGNTVLVTKDGVRNHDGNRGVRPALLKCHEGAWWREATAESPGAVCIEDTWYIKLHTPEEIDVFNALGLPWIEPRLRTVENYQRWAARRDSRALPDRRAQLYRLGYSFASL